MGSTSSRAWASQATLPPRTSKLATRSPMSSLRRCSVSSFGPLPRESPMRSGREGCSGDSGISELLVRVQFSKLSPPSVQAVLALGKGLDRKVWPTNLIGAALASSHLSGIVEYCTCWSACNFQSSARQVYRGGPCPWQGSGQESSADQSYWSGTGQFSSFRNCKCERKSSSTAWFSVQRRTISWLLWVLLLK